MELRELKKEAEQLPVLSAQVKKFQDSWVKPLRSNTNSHLPFINTLHPETKGELNQRLSELQRSIDAISSSSVHEKFQSYARALIELKLSQLQGHSSTAKMVHNHLQHDSFLNMSYLQQDMAEFHLHIQRLAREYEEINDVLHKSLSLEETISFLNLPHKLYLQPLLELVERHQRIARDLERHLVSLRGAHGH